MHLGTFVSGAVESQRELAEAFRLVAEVHGDEPDIQVLCRRLGEQSERHATLLEPFLEQYPPVSSGEGGPHSGPRFHGPRKGAMGLLLDLTDLYILASEVDITWTLVAQAAQGVRDEPLLKVVNLCEQETHIHLKWLQTRLKQGAPQVLVAAG
jgi:hypothetical protein